MMIPARRATPGSMSALFVLVVFGASTSLAEKNHQVANHEKDDPTDWWEGDENAWWDEDANDWWKTDTEGKDEKDEKEEDERKVDAFGAFTDAIPLEVPEFHGIAPELSLTYKSSGVNGWLGVGWTLEGLGLIERASPGKGAPSYDDGSDIFLFDGEELVPCAPGSVSPSCAAGGTHSTKTENYTRIAFTGAGADSRWTITRKDGTEAVYAPVYGVDPGPDGSWGTADDVYYKWGLSQVTDTSGNAVTYSWATDQFGCCWEHPESISYNGAVITFYYEPRPDVELVATGVGLSTLRGRLETIDVTVSGSRVRAYKLSYAASPASERSLLSSVQQFGSDAVVDGSGTVVGGTSLPARAAGYQAGTPGFVAGGTDTGMHSGEFSQFLPMDINGDGLTDMLEVYRACFVLCANKHAAWISDGSGFTRTSESNIADPQYSRFLVADVNGDGMDDAVELYRNAFLFVTWGRRIWLSNGDGFTNAGTDNDIGVYDEDSRFFAMDINGDGLTDMLELYPSWGSYRRRTWISDGTTFIETSDESGMHYSDAARFYPIDINGDGKSDLVELFQFSVSWARRVWISHGTGLYEAGTDYSISFDNDKHLMPMDVNGDGKTDMVEIGAGAFGSYQRRVWLSTGVDFTLASSTTGNCLLSESEFLPADINGDGRGDLIELCRLSVTYQRRLWLSGGDDFVAGASDGGLTFISDPQYRALDVNGDGLTEMVQLHTVPIFGGTARSLWFVGGAHADLLTSLENDAGGTTTVSYEPSSTWENTNNPPIVQTAAEVSVHDGRGDVDTTTYSHAGGLYDRAERRFLGFRYQTETRPCIAGESGCPYTETWLRQDYGAATKPERVDRRDGDGQLLTSTVYEYTTNGATVPWTSLATGRWDYTYINGGASCPGSDCKRTYFARTFNEYGELTQEIDHGDYDEAGDERTRATAFVPNTTAYLVSKPADEKLFDGAGTAGALLNETLRYYDGAASWNQPPSAGLQTKEARWLSSPSSFVETRREYDAWGNVTAEIDALGARTEIEIDPIYHRFPTSTTNPLGQVTTTAWDAGCGEQTRTTDLNGQPTTMTYDPLCRLAETIAPGGKFERHTWVNLGDAGTQHELIERPGADGTGDPLWTATYFDGHRRIWRTASKGPDAATGDIYVDTTYNGRSQVAAVTEPYYWAAGASQPATYATTLGYDAVDRLTEVTFADGAQLTRSFALWSVTLTDELGRSKTDHKDADGNRIAHEEIVAGQVETVTYVYDGRGHLTRSIDPHDNVTTYAIDSLGRRTQVIDPDWGVWTYEYDAAGRATAHTDPRGQRTTFGHDLLGRKTSKTSLAGTGSAESVSWTYDQPAGGYYNIGKLTTMTDGAGEETVRLRRRRTRRAYRAHDRRHQLRVRSRLRRRRPGAVDHLSRRRHPGHTGLAAAIRRRGPAGVDPGLRPLRALRGHRQARRARQRQRHRDDAAVRPGARLADADHDLLGADADPGPRLRAQREGLDHGGRERGRERPLDLSVRRARSAGLGDERVGPGVRPELLVRRHRQHHLELASRRVHLRLAPPARRHRRRIEYLHLRRGRPDDRGRGPNDDLGRRQPSGVGHRTRRQYADDVHLRRQRRSHPAGRGCDHAALSRRRLRDRGRRRHQEVHIGRRRPGRPHRGHDAVLGPRRSPGIDPGGDRCLGRRGPSQDLPSLRRHPVVGRNPRGRAARLRRPAPRRLRPAVSARTLLRPGPRSLHLARPRHRRPQHRGSQPLRVLRERPRQPEGHQRPGR